MYKSEYDEVKANLIKKSLEKDKTDVYIPIERRKGKDTILKFINFICFLGWIVVVLILAIIEKAGNSILYITKNDLLFQPSNFWNVRLLNKALIATIACFCVCAICIILNFTRHKRRTDRIKRSLIYCQLICFIIGIFLILKLY